MRPINGITVGKRYRSVGGLLVLVGVLAAVPAVSGYATTGPVGGATTQVRADFNGDGAADLAMGVRGENSSSGAVHVLYGGSNGLTGPGQFWNQDSPGMPDTAEEGDGFGNALAMGDFNGDGYTDLAVGVPSEDVGSVANAGMVQVLYGSSGGLTTNGVQDWHQDTPDMPDVAEAGDSFGTALTSGDFDGDGYLDLAIGVPLESVDGIGSAGVAQVLYGSSVGLTAPGSQMWHQNTPGVADAAESSDRLGFTLNSGDFNGDGEADLAIGVPYEGIGTTVSAGVVHVLYGSSVNGLTAIGSQLWHQNKSGVADAAETWDQFGFDMTSGDFNADGEADLAIGVAFEDIGTTADAGVVQVLYGSSPSGLTATGSQYWSQDTTDVLDQVESQDWFGLSVTAGDFNGDGEADLAIGVPLEDVGNVNSVGVVQVLYGSSPNGLTATGNQLLYQGYAGLEDSAEAGDNFGWELAAADFDGDGQADLAIGAQTEDVSGVYEVGAVQTVYGDPSGLTGTGDQLWYQGGPLGDTPESGDYLGQVMAAG